MGENTMTDEEVKRLDPTPFAELDQPQIAAIFQHEPIATTEIHHGADLVLRHAVKELRELRLQVG